jgi:hypothetical protein
MYYLLFVFYLYILLFCIILLLFYSKLRFILVQSNCIDFMREYCKPEYQNYPLALQMDTTETVKNQTVAAFLIVRPPYGWLGWGWESDERNWDPIFLLAVGEPSGNCVEGPSGVFSRTWSAGTPVLDCNLWSASLPFNSI